jgi:hypothetical protein
VLKKPNNNTVVHQVDAVVVDRGRGSSPGTLPDSADQRWAQQNAFRGHLNRGHLQSRRGHLEVSDGAPGLFFGASFWHLTSFHFQFRHQIPFSGHLSVSFGDPYRLVAPAEQRVRPEKSNIVEASGQVPLLRCPQNA